MAILSKAQLKTWLKRSIAILFIGIVYFKLIEINFETIRDVLLSVEFLLALLLYLVSQIVSALRSFEILHYQGYVITFKEVLKIYFKGISYSMLLPGGISGDAFKIYIFQKNLNHISKKSLLLFQLMERGIGLLSITLLISLTFGLLQISSSNGLYIGIGFFIISSFILLIQVLIGKIFFDNKLSIYLIISSLFIQFLQISAVLLLIKELGSLQEICVYIITFLTGSIASILPISIGGLGIRELIAQNAESLYKMPLNHLLVAVIGFNLITVLSSTFGLFLNTDEKK